MRLPTFLLLPVFLLFQPNCGLAEEGNWPQFRGNSRSVALSRELPTAWSSEEGLVWEKPLAGFGQSSPIIWGKSIYVTSTGGKHKENLFLEAFSLKKGERQWLRKIEASKIVEAVSKMISQGAPTPAANPDGIFAFFESGDLVAFDHAGAPLWQRDLQKEFGDFKGAHGVGSSLLSAQGKLILLIDHDGPSYLLCLDPKTGKTIWKTDRKPRVSWSTPLIVQDDGEWQILVSSNGIVEAFQLEDGKRLWWFDSIKKNTVASPASNADLVVVGSSDPRQSMAIRMGGTGDVTKTHLAWRAESATSSFASPIIDREIVYLVSRTGMLQAQSLATGKQLWKKRLPDSAWASPISDGKHLYFFCKNGKSMVLDSSLEEPKIISENSIPLTEDETLYGAAAGQTSFILRSGRRIFKVGR